MEYLTLELFRSVAAGTAGRVYLMPPTSAETWQVLSISYLPQATSAANATNYGSLRPYKDTATPTALAAARTTASTALTQGTAENVTLTASGADLEITQADPLYIDMTHSGTGVAMDVLVAVRFQVLRS